MKEITRIHVAKTPYDIELPAKKELEAYLRALEAYSHSTEITQDVEIRITELLLERGVKKGDVITAADITALKKQLGEPEDFLEEGDIAIGNNVTADSNRRLYRNTDNALLGGVLSGIATFFNINPVWTRLLFIVLLFGSFGTAIILYVVLWAVIPAAKTAADKLQMSGRAVTVGAIRELNELEKDTVKSSDQTGIRILLLAAGIISIVIAASAFFVTVAAGIFGIVQRHNYFPGSEWFVSAFILMIIAGILCTALFTLTTYASFARKMNKRIAVSAGIIIALGLTVASVAGGLAYYGGIKQQEVIKANTHTRTVAVPTEAARSLYVAAQDIEVRYIVSSEAPSASLKTIGEKAKKSNVSLTNEEGKLVVTSDKLTATKDEDCKNMWLCHEQHRTLEIKGPALNTITADSNTQIAYSAGTQPDLTVDIQKEATFTLEAGNVKNMTTTVKQGAHMNGETATISDINLTIEPSASAQMGAVNNLTLSDQNSCPTNQEATVTLWKVSGTLTINRATKPAVSTNLACTQLIIEGEEDL